MATLLMFHSSVRWLIVLVAFAVIIKFAAWFKKTKKVDTGPLQIVQ